jgi:hypothetical protein
MKILLWSDSILVQIWVAFSVEMTELSFRTFLHLRRNVFIFQVRTIFCILLRGEAEKTLAQESRYMNDEIPQSSRAAATSSAHAGKTARYLLQHHEHVLSWMRSTSSNISVSSVLACMYRELLMSISGVWNADSVILFNVSWASARLRTRFSSAPPEATASLSQAFTLRQSITSRFLMPSTILASNLMHSSLNFATDLVLAKYTLPLEGPSARRSGSRWSVHAGCSGNSNIFSCSRSLKSIAHLSSLIQRGDAK